MEGEMLLPGLPDDVTLDQVVTRLPWTAFRVLVSVSRLWRKAIRSHRVHDARVRANSTEKLFVLNYIDGENHEITLFSASDGAWLKLPRYPKSLKNQRGMPRFGQCVSLDGRIYVLGGVKPYDFHKLGENRDDDWKIERSEAYVLDVAGYRGWKKCASMPNPRHRFGCGVADGKIYVFGGATSSDMTTRDGQVISSPMVTRSCLVYDPTENAWSSVRPMERLRICHDVVTVGEELFVHGGMSCDKREHTEVYHPGRDEWRSLEPFGIHEAERLFNAKGKLHMITRLGIYGHDIDSDGKYSWTLQHSFRYEEDEANEDELPSSAELCLFRVEAVSDVLVNGELLGLLNFGYAGESEARLCQSKGFGTEKKEMLWNRIMPCENIGSQDFPRIMCPVQL